MPFAAPHPRPRSAAFHGHPHRAARHRRRERGLRLARLLALSALLGAGSAGAAQAAGRPDAASLNAYRVSARTRAALELSLAGRPDDALIQLAKAEQGPLPATGAARSPLTAAAARLRAAITAGDQRGARDAARAAGDAAAATAADGRAADLVAALVTDAGHEGQEAAEAEGAEATEPRAYALALVGVASDLAARAGLPATARDALTVLAASVRGGADAATVRSATATALTALGAPLPQRDVARALDAIDHDLDVAVTRYRAGDAQGAQDALIDGYLNDYEGLEPALREKNAELMQRLERTLASDLRDLARRGVPAERFEAAVERARSDLAEAREALR